MSVMYAEKNRRQNLRVFDEAVDGREDIGWSGKWEKDGWKDICPECKEDE